MKEFLGLVALVLSLQTSGQSSEVNALLGKAFQHRTTFDTGLYYSNQAYVLSSELTLAEGQSRAKAYSGIIHYNANRRDTAIALLYEALPFLDDFPLEKGLVLWTLGKANVYTRDFDEATAKYELAIKELQIADSLEIVADVYSSQGIIYGRQASYSEALDWFIKAIEQRVKLGREKENAGDIGNAATCYMRLGNFEKSLEFAWKGINLRDDDNDASIYSSIGGTFNISGNPDSALYYYKKSHSLSLADNDLEGVAIALSNMANIHYQKEAHREAVKLLKEAYQMEGRHDRSKFGNLTELGKNYRRLGDLDSAAHYLRSGLRLSQKFKNKQWSKESSTFLGYLFADMGVYDSAFHYLTISLAYKDSLNNDQVQDLFANQRVKIETLDKEFEIEQLEREAELKQTEQEKIMVLGISGAIILILLFFNYRTRMQLNQRVLQNKNRDLTSELERNKALLSSHTLSMIHRKNGFEDIEAELKEVEGSGKQKIKNIISVNKALEKDWENFQNYFSQVHSDFFDILKRKHPDLTQSEVRMSALVKMDLANKEIASLLNIESKSVKMAKYRLKKKLNLLEDASLNEYLRDVLS